MATNSTESFETKAKVKIKVTSRSKAKPQTGMSHEAQLENLARIEGQVRGIARMINDNRYCPDILVQIKALIAAMRAVESNIAEQHLRGCVLKAISSRNKQAAETALEEVSALLKSASR